MRSAENRGSVHNKLKKIVKEIGKKILVYTKAYNHYRFSLLTSLPYSEPFCLLNVKMLIFKYGSNMKLVWAG